MWTAIAQFAAALMKLITKRNEDKNAEDMKARAIAQDREKCAARIADDLEKRNLEQIRKDDSE